MNYFLINSLSDFHPGCPLQGTACLSPNGEISYRLAASNSSNSEQVSERDEKIGQKGAEMGKKNRQNGQKRDKNGQKRYKK